MTRLGDPPKTPSSTRHRLDGPHFDALARGGGDPDTISRLLAAERSWRLVQLRAVLDSVGDQPESIGPLPPVARAWQLLVDAHRQAPAEVDRLLLHPQAGTWSGYVLRRLRGTHPHPADDPLWVDLGYLHALAAAAGIRARMEFTLPVPVRDGFAALPTLGGAYLDSAARWGTAEVRAAAGTATITGSGHTVRINGDGWLAVPAFECEAGGHTLSIGLDHLDPYRNLRAPTAPDQLDADQVRGWRRLLEQAWQLLVDTSPHLATPIACGLFSVTPLPATGRFRTRSASSGDAFGGMIASEPEDAPELAVTLVHEFQHIKLGGLLHLVSLQHREPPQRLHAPWRDDPRPLGGLLQGVYAFAGIVEFWRCLRQTATGRTAAMAQFEFARWRAQVQATLSTLDQLPELTDFGRELVTRLAATAAGWQAEPVPPDLLAAADAAVVDSRVRWRLHHLRPEPQVVKELATAWRPDAPPPDVGYPEPAVAADQAARHLDVRAVLELWRLTDPSGFAQLQHVPETVGKQVSGATPADLLAVGGQADQAQALYLADIDHGPGSPAAWAGLAVHHRAAGALRTRPELVRAVHRDLSGAGVAAGALELARWLS